MELESSLLFIPVRWHSAMTPSSLQSSGTDLVSPFPVSAVKNQFVGLYKILRNDYLIFFLFPYFLASNWIYVLQFNNFNSVQFTLRGRALNSLLYWLANIVGAGLFGLAIDSTRFRRTRRAWAAFVFIFCMGMAVWGATYHYMR